MAFLKMHSKGNVLYTLCIFFNKTSACILFSCLLCLQKPSLHPDLRPALSPTLLLSTWVVRVAPTLWGFTLVPTLVPTPGRVQRALWASS